MTRGRTPFIGGGTPVNALLDGGGDHNWWTVSEELRIVAERAPGADLPLLLFHDVCWPHARRDDYFDASQIPADSRHPVAGDAGGIYPGDPGLRINVYTAEPGTPSEDALKVLASWAATQQPAKIPFNIPNREK